MRKYKKKLEMAMTVLILAGSFYIGRCTAAVVKGERVNPVAATAQGKMIVVVDAGHGGFDAGKVGINDALEKEVNLSIAKKLKGLLEQENIQVVMTRESDAGLYDESEENKKQQDMKRRCTIINESGAAIAVSIHQNSYTEESVHGPQVFYYETSADAKVLAHTLQEILNTELKIDRPRSIKANDSYYILRKTAVPTVIVECGFLSNGAEAAKLITEEYQQQVAEAICRGVQQFLNNSQETASAGQGCGCMKNELKLCRYNGSINI